MVEFCKHRSLQQFPGSLPSFSLFEVIMRWLLLFVFCSRVFAASFEDAVPSSPDETASLSTNLLIEELFSPLSGQVSLYETDLHWLAELQVRW